MVIQHKPASTAYIFPGQGSQILGMGLELAEAFPAARQVFDTADELLGFEISRLAWDGPEIELNDTINTQPAMLVHSVAVLRVFQQKFPTFRPAFVAGHSMGELSALVAAGALSFEHALPLARRRGELMKEAGKVSPGGMAAVLGCDLPTLEKICREASTSGQIVQVANDNCPGQIVISGATHALERAIKMAQAAGVRKIRPLAVSIAAHSPLMEHAQERFNQAVAEAPLVDPSVPLVGNVTAEPLRTADQLRNDLRQQLTSPVRWSDSIRYMAGQGVATFFEFGCGAVLSGLIKRIDENLVGISISTPADFGKLAPP